MLRAISDVSCARGDYEKEIEQDAWQLGEGIRLLEL